MRNLVDCAYRSLLLLLTRMPFFKLVFTTLQDILSIPTSCHAKKTADNEKGSQNYIAPLKHQSWWIQALHSHRGVAERISK